MNADIDIRNTVLKTDRLVLRVWRTEDLNDLYAYASLDGALDMIGRPPHQSLAESEEVLKRYIEGGKNFAMVYAGRVIGSFGIEKYNEAMFPEFDHLRCRELSFILSKLYWGQGLVPEAVREVLRYLFMDVGLDVVFCGHFVKNTRSARVQEKCGFRHYAFRQFTTRFGTVEEDDLSILTREDWLSFSPR